MERKLATIQHIDNLSPIPGADFIEVATVKGWKLVVKKGEYTIGDKAVYCEIDSLLPIREEFEFLRKSSYKKVGDQEGFRLKTVKLKGQISQGLLLPISTLNGKIENPSNLSIGTEVTELLGIVKYDPPIPAELAGSAKGLFPSFLNKTDEERIQNLASEYENLKRETYYVTEKLDGSSATYYWKDGEFGVCSRNLELLRSESNSFWVVAKELELEEKLSKLGKNLCLQGELIGWGVQGNLYNLKGRNVYFFNAFDIDTQKYLTYTEFLELVKDLGLETVPILEKNFTLPDSLDELILLADGKSKLNNSKDREGLVLRNHERTVSFKAISNKFLIKSES